MSDKEKSETDNKDNTPETKAIVTLESKTKKAKTPPEKTAEEKLIDEAVNEINRITLEKVYDAYSEIGKYILITFFKDDPKNASSRNPHKEDSYSKLCKRNDMPFSKIALSRMLRVACFERELAVNKIDIKSIPYTHKLIILRIEDKDKRIAKAKVISEKNISSRQLEMQIRKEFPNPNKPSDNIKKAIYKFGRIRDSITKIKFPEIEGLINQPDIANNETLFQNVEELKTKIQQLMTNCNAILKLKSKSKPKTNIE